VLRCGSAVVFAALALATPAQAHLTAGAAVEHAASCPAGAPVQTVTVVDEAHIRSWALARVENTIVRQSVQLRAAWGTPCVEFGPGGWSVYLKVSRSEPHGEHDYDGQPYALVWTAGGTVESWSRDLSHEVIEMLEDPTLDVRYLRDGSTWRLEIADPVEGLGYRLDGVWVSDFVLPAWYAGATTGTDVTCQGDVCVDSSPLIAPPNAPGPYDQMGLLTGPWQSDNSAV
jgi:hypothetical protein